MVYRVSWLKHDFLPFFFRLKCPLYWKSKTEKSILTTRACWPGTAFQKCVIEIFHHTMQIHNPMTFFLSNMALTNGRIWNLFSVPHSRYKGEHFKRKENWVKNLVF